MMAFQVKTLLIPISALYVRNIKYMNLFSAVYYSAKEYKYRKDHPATKQQEEEANVFESYLLLKETWLVFLIASAVVLGIILLTLVFLRKRIMLAIALIREGSRYVIPRQLSTG